MMTHSLHTHTGMSVNWCVYHISYSVLSFTPAPFRMQQSSAICGSTFWQHTRFFMSPRTQKSSGLKPGDHGWPLLWTVIPEKSKVKTQMCQTVFVY